MNPKKEKCFIIMPISTPKNVIDKYKGDNDHFNHVLEHLFIPALEKVGLKPIPPKSVGSDLIQAEIIKQLSTTDLVLCDMSILNPNVFFECGIRTALDKPVSMVVDDITSTTVPFDTKIINFHTYKSSLEPWHLKDDIDNLAEHVRESLKRSGQRNSLWKYFGVAQTGVFKPEEAKLGEKVDLLMKEVASLKDSFGHRTFTAGETDPYILGSSYVDPTTLLTPSSSKVWYSKPDKPFTFISGDQITKKGITEENVKEVVKKAIADSLKAEKKKKSQEE